MRSLILLALVVASTATLAQEDSPRPVTVAPLSEVVFYPEHTAPATALSLNDARVSTEISGLVKALPVSVGDRVAAGEVVAQMDCRDAEISLAEARAALKAGRAKYRFDVSQLKKGRKLAKSKNISKDEVDRRSSTAAISEAEVDRSKANVAKAEAAVQRCEVKAPFAAVVTERLASIGDFLQRGEPIVRLLDINNIEVRANIQEKDLDSFKAAGKFELVTRNASYSLKLRTLLPQMDSRLRSFEARFTFSGEAAVSGSAGRLVWHSSRPHIPADLVVKRGGMGVFVVDQQNSRFVPQPNALAGLPVPTNLDLSTRIIIEGRFNLTDNEPIVTTEP